MIFLQGGPKFEVTPLLLIRRLLASGPKFHHCSGKRRTAISDRPLTSLFGLPVFKVSRPETIHLL